MANGGYKPTSKYGAPHCTFLFLRKWRMIAFRMLLLLPTVEEMIKNIQEYNQLYIYICAINSNIDLRFPKTMCITYHTWSQYLSNKRTKQHVCRLNHQNSTLLWWVWTLRLEEFLRYYWHISKVFIWAVTLLLFYTATAAYYIICKYI